MGGHSRQYKGLSGVEPTASDLGAVLKAGDTMTGTLNAPRVNANRLNSGVLNIVSSGGTTLLTNASAATIYITGSTTHTLRLPDATTLENGDCFEIFLTSTSAVATAVTGSDGSPVLWNAGTNAFVYIKAQLTDNTTVGGTWNVIYGTSGNTAGSFVARNASGAINVGSVSVTGNVIASGNVSSSTLSNPRVALTYGATVTPAFNSGQLFSLLLTGNVTTFANPTNNAVGYKGVLDIIQDATGNRTIGSWDYLYSFAGGTPPTLSTAGAAKDSFDYYVDSFATGTVTITIGTPAIITQAGHGLNFGDKVQFTTTGALPTGLSVNTTYYVNVVNVNNYNVATSLANLRAGTYVTTSGTQSGTHTATAGSIIITPRALNVL